MPSYISKGGVCYPAKEKVPLVNHGAPFEDPKTGNMVETGDPYIYEGPCRAALFELWEANGKPEISNEEETKDLTMGLDFRKDPDFLKCVRETGFGHDVKGYLDYVGYDHETENNTFEKKASVVKTHELPKRVKEIKNLAGGQDKTGGSENFYGGFGPQKLNRE